MLCSCIIPEIELPKGVFRLMSQERLAQGLISWIKDSVLAAGGKGVVFGMSGGVDSSMVAVLCRNAFPETSLGIIMPCHSDSMDEEHAELVANKFNIPVKVVVLDKAFDSMIEVLSENNYDMSTRMLAENNIKPRLRMLTLYYFANRLNNLVVGSGNRCELFVGYFTKYGDSGADMFPLANLVKGQIRDLAIYLGLPREIINKPPSAGLWIGQTDEMEMGLTYEELDHYLLTGKAEEKIKEKIATMVKRSDHKRHLPLVPPLFS